MDISRFLADALAATDAEKRFGYLRLAAEYVRENNGDPLLNYTLCWMVRHRKFPIMKHITVKHGKRPAPSQESIRQEKVRFLREMAENPTNNISYDREWQRRLIAFRRAFTKANPMKCTKATQFIWLFTDDTRKVEHYLSYKLYASNRPAIIRSCGTDTLWEAVAWLMECLKPFYEQWQIGEPVV